MIPYFQVPPLHLGPIAIEPFGIFVALGLLLAAKVAMTCAEQDGRDPKLLEDFALWGLGAGVIGAHLVHLFFYHPEELARGPLQLLKVWDGLASTGGVLGGVLAAVVFFRLRRARFTDYSDALALGLAPGWAIARLGCFVIHDHPGVKTGFFLAVRFPGGARHDLGLDDALLLFAIAGLLFALRQRRLLAGRLLGVLSLLYGLGRFGLDFLRARDLPYVDARYLGLTPAQYGCILLVAYGVYQLARRTVRTGSAPPPGAPLTGRPPPRLGTPDLARDPRRSSGRQTAAGRGAHIQGERG